MVTEFMIWDEPQPLNWETDLVAKPKNHRELKSKIAAEKQ